MDFLRRRERRKLTEDFIDLRRQDDYQQRRKEYCLIRIIYRQPNPRRRRKIDEIMIIQHNHAVFKGCLKDGDQFTFKSERYRNESRVKLKFYINDFLEEEMIACCEHGLMDRNRPEHLFQIEKIVGAKPCDNCEFYDETSSEIPSSYSRQNSSRKDPISASKPKEKKSTVFLPQTTTNNKAPSEGFSADLTEQPNRNESDEDPTDVVSPLPPSPLKQRYGPPQVSVIETPSPGVRQSPLSGLLFSSPANTPQTTTDQPVRTESTQRQSSAVETNTNEPTTAANLNRSDSIAAAADATQLLLQQLGITRQEQVERPDVARIIPPREKGNVENFTLVYLHDSYPDESIVKHLRSLVNFLKIFNDGDDCIAFINTVVDEKIILILSHSFHEAVLSRIEELQQIFMIYILSENNDQLDIPAEKPKFRGVYSNIDDMYEQVSNDIKIITRDLVLYFTASSNGTSLQAVVVYSLLLNEIILDTTETKSDMKELINFSRDEYEGNDEELKVIDEFENNYQKNQAIGWFSRSCFISKILNKALRIPEPDVLFRFRSFVQDLFQQIREESTSESITIYFGQTIERADLDNLQKNILTTDMMIIPQFLFGSTDQERAIRIAKQIPLLGEDAIPLIIRIDISEDFKYATFVFPRYSTDEDNNILLNMGAMGRLIKVEKENIHEDQIAQIHLRLVKSEEQQNIQHILQTTRAEVKSFSAFTGMIKLMMQMNQQSSAEQLVQSMVDNENLKSDANFQASMATACLILAQAHRTQGNYQQAVDLFLLSVKVFHRIVSPNAAELSPIYSNIGGMFFRLQDYEKSREYYQMAVDTQLQSTTPDFYTIGSFTKSLGTVYVKQKKYSEAIKSFERTLRILQQCPESHDDELAATYDDLGEAYLLQLKHDEAIENYSKALEIQERAVPRNPQTLGTLYNTIGNIHLKLGRSKEALMHLKRGLECFQQILPLTHPTFALLYNNVGLMYYREEQHDDAMKCYAKVLEIAAISLPENHSLVAVTLFNMGLCYSSQEKYDEAIEVLEKSTAQFLKTLPPDHADVLDNKKHIETIRQKKVLRDIFNENTTSS